MIVPKAIRSLTSPSDFTLASPIADLMLNELLAITPEPHEQTDWYCKNGPLRHGTTRWVRRGQNTVAPLPGEKNRYTPGSLKVKPGLGGQEKIDRVLDVPSLSNIFAPFSIQIIYHRRRVRRVYLHTLLPGDKIEKHSDRNEYFLNHERWHVFLSKPNMNHRAIYDGELQNYNYGDVRFFNLFCEHQYENLDETEPFHLLVFDIKKKED